MRWSDRQQAMLAEMGLRQWLPQGATAPESMVSAEAQPAPALALPEAARPATSAKAANVAATHRTGMAGGEPASKPPKPAASPPVGQAPTPANDHPARPPATVASADWATLSAEVTACRACGLCDSRQQTVFGLGHPQAHFMVVGEAPGEHEDLCGEPFVGESGQLLDRMLLALGLTRTGANAGADPDPARQVFITNALKCRPPRNRNPAPAELAACQPYLERQVALVQPRVILAMGAFAVQSLLASNEPIGRLRGRVHHWRGVPLVVTYHPAYLLRQPAHKARAWDDLCLAASCLDRPAA